MDKLTHNLAFTCKLYYLHKLYTEIHSNAYTPTNRTLPNILRDHKNFNSKYSYKHADVLPYLYAIPKLYKNPPKIRYIAGVSTPLPPDPNTNQLQRIFHRPPYAATCSTTPASKHLCAFLKSVMHFIRMKDNECYKTNGYRRCWFVTNIDKVFQEIKQNLPILKGLQPRTFDFATMYTTNIPHQKIFNNIQAAVTEAIAYRNSLPQNTSLPLLPDPDIIIEHLRL